MRAPARLAGDRGSATLQIVVLMPALFLLMFTGMQGALIYHARTVAIAAAQEGARNAAAQYSSAAAGDRRIPRPWMAARSRGRWVRCSTPS